MIEEQTTSWLIVIDIIGIAVGLISIGMILTTLREIGGVIGRALAFFVVGMLFQVLALLWTLLFSRLELFKTALDVHHLLMTVGLIFFVVSAIKLSKIKR